MVCFFLLTNRNSIHFLNEFGYFELRIRTYEKKQKEKYPTMNEEIFPHSLSRKKIH